MFTVKVVWGGSDFPEYSLYSCRKVTHQVDEDAVTLLLFGAAEDDGTIPIRLGDEESVAYIMNANGRTVDIVRFFPIDDYDEEWEDDEDEYGYEDEEEFDVETV